ncbi:MAG: protein-glutamate O-methyltransferase CheR, partial [bacterium]
YLRNNPDEITPFLDVISTNTTKFYREQRHWEYLMDELVPAWRDQSRINAWSAACSSGEEPYTLALLLEHSLRKGATTSLAGRPYRILSTDLSDDVLRRGMRGVYSKDAFEPLADQYPNIVRNYCQQRKNGYLKIDEEIRDRVVFRQFNLKSDNYPYRRKFDLVLIRNVLIYFDNEMKQHVIDGLSRSLKKGGTLFIGHSESLNNIDHQLTRERPAIYRK